MIVGTGIDIIEVTRIEKALQRWGDHFIHHVFCDEEIAYARKHKFPAQHFAARFAAKEAVFKALGSVEPSVGWKDLKILNQDNGKPYCLINKEDFRFNIHLSISHSENYAVANAIITA